MQTNIIRQFFELSGNKKAQVIRLGLLFDWILLFSLVEKPN